MRRTCARRAGALYAAWTAALACALAGCGGGIPVDERMVELGPRIGFDLSLGWQETEFDMTESSMLSHSEGEMEWSYKLVSFTWGFQTLNHWFEPCFLVGTGSATIDNFSFSVWEGPTAAARVEDIAGTAVGGGLKVRWLFVNTPVRYGVDIKAVVFSGKCAVTVDNLPALSGPHDAKTAQLDFWFVMDYDDPSYRPYLCLGVLLTGSELDGVASPGDPVTINSQDNYAVKAGVVFKQLFGSPMDGEIAVGYCSGPVVSLALGYRF